MTILTWLVLGLVVGWIAHMLTGEGGGLLGDLFLGIIGALVGGWLGAMLVGVPVTGFNLTSIVISVLGAMIVVGIYRAIVAPRRPTY